MIVPEKATEKSKAKRTWVFIINFYLSNHIFLFI